MAENEGNKSTPTVEDQKRKNLSLFKEESAKCESWKSKYIANSMFALGSGAFGSVFQATTRLYTNKLKISRNMHMYHPNFVSTIASQRKLKPEAQDKLRDRTRDTSLLDIVAIKYEILQQAHLEEGATRFYLFLRREFLVLDTIWRKNHRIMHGFPMTFDFGYVGDKSQFGVNPKYRNIFTYLNIEGEEVKFFTDGYNRNLEGVTKISFMSMELLGPSIDDFRSFFEPWYSGNDMRTFFNVRTTFKIADQLLCRLLVLHKCGFVHHDIKPDNIAMGNGRAMNTIYLLDFGFAKQVSTTAKPSEWMGSRKFISVDTYNGARPNYAQDIESWFYLVLDLLYDALPWMDEFIRPMLGENADESAHWNLVTQMKKTWWGELSEAGTLKNMIKSIASLHSQEVPDIKGIIEQLHRKTRELRSVMRSIDDSLTLNFELANNQSTIVKCYMSVRKIMLQIFDLPKISLNPHLGDSEFRSLQDSRTEKGMAPFSWDPHNYGWEWDMNHKLLSQKGMEQMKMVMEMVDPANQHCSTPLGIRRGSRTSVNSLLVMGRGKVQRPEEISYVFDRENQQLLPKCNDYQCINAHAAPVPFTGNANRDGLFD